MKQRMRLATGLTFANQRLKDDKKSGHEYNHLPVVLLGKGGGQIRTGRVLDYLNRPNRKMCSLYLSLMEKAGVRLDRFGDSNQRLDEI